MTHANAGLCNHLEDTKMFLSDLIKICKDKKKNQNKKFNNPNVSLKFSLLTFRTLSCNFNTELSNEEFKNMNLLSVCCGEIILT